MKIKTILLSVAMIASIASCKDDDDKFKGNNSPIYIYGQDKTNKTESMETKQSETVHEILTNHEVLTLTGEIETGRTGSLLFIADGGKSRGWEVNSIDTINDRLVMAGANIIENEHIYQWGGVFLAGRNFYIQDDDTQDTLGYIPNSVIREAQKDILDMWKAGDISAIYERFQQAFYFTPCTAEEFKAIKEDIDWEHEYDDLKAEHEHTHEIRW